MNAFLIMANFLLILANGMLAYQSWQSSKLNQELFNLLNKNFGELIMHLASDREKH